VIQDSGQRREFATGAVRDIQEGKGRCDLLPLDVAAMILQDSKVLRLIAEFQRSEDKRFLYEALDIFRNSCDWNDATMLLEVAKHMEDGAKKYGERNWEKGLPVSCFIDSAVRHYLKWRRGDEDERHDRAFCWNVMCCIWTCCHKPELNTYANKEKEERRKNEDHRAERGAHQPHSLRNRPEHHRGGRAHLLPEP